MLSKSSRSSWYCRRIDLSKNLSKRGFERNRRPPSSSARKNAPAPGTWVQTHFWSLLGCFFQEIGQNGRPGGWEAPRSISFDETSRTSRRKSVAGGRRKVIFFIFFRRWTNLCTIWLKINPNLHGKTRHRRRAKLAAALRAAANFGRRGCRVFPRNSGVISA